MQRPPNKNVRPTRASLLLQKKREEQAALERAKEASLRKSKAKKKTSRTRIDRQGTTVESETQSVTVEYATTEAPPGQSGKDPRVVNTYNRMLDTALELQQEQNEFEALERQFEEEGAVGIDRRSIQWQAAPEFFGASGMSAGTTRYSKFDAVLDDELMPDDMHDALSPGLLNQQLEDLNLLYSDKFGLPAVSCVPVTVPRRQISPIRPSPDRGPVESLRQSLSPESRRRILPSSPPPLQEESLHLPTTPTQEQDFYKFEYDSPVIQYEPMKPLLNVNTSIVPQHKQFTPERLSDIQKQFLQKSGSSPHGVSIFDVPADQLLEESPPMWTPPAGSTSPATPEELKASLRQYELSKQTRQQPVASTSYRSPPKLHPDLFDLPSFDSQILEEQLPEEFASPVITPTTSPRQGAGVSPPSYNLCERLKTLSPEELEHIRKILEAQPLEPRIERRSKFKSRLPTIGSPVEYPDSPLTYRASERVSSAGKRNVRGRIQGRRLDFGPSPEGFSVAQPGTFSGLFEASPQGAAALPPSLPDINEPFYTTPPELRRHPLEFARLPNQNQTDYRNLFYRKPPSPEVPQEIQEIDEFTRLERATEAAAAGEATRYTSSQFAASSRQNAEDIAMQQYMSLFSPKTPKKAPTMQEIWNQAKFMSPSPGYQRAVQEEKERMAIEAAQRRAREAAEYRAREEAEQQAAMEAEIAEYQQRMRARPGAEVGRGARRRIPTTQRQSARASQSETSVRSKESKPELFKRPKVKKYENVQSKVMQGVSKPKEPKETKSDTSVKSKPSTSSIKKTKKKKYDVPSKLDTGLRRKRTEQLEVVSVEPATLQDLGLAQANVVDVQPSTSGYSQMQEAASYQDVPLDLSSSIGQAEDESYDPVNQYKPLSVKRKGVPLRAIQSPNLETVAEEIMHPTRQRDPTQMELTVSAADYHLQDGDNLPGFNAYDDMYAGGETDDLTMEEAPWIGSPSFLEAVSPEDNLRPEEQTAIMEAQTGSSWGGHSPLGPHERNFQWMSPTKHGDKWPWET